MLLISQPHLHGVKEEIAQIGHRIQGNGTPRPMETASFGVRDPDRCCFELTVDERGKVKGRDMMVWEAITRTVGF